MILAIDPGGTTGLAMRFSEDSITTATTKDPKLVWELVVVADTVICEQFNPWHAHIDRYGLHTVKIIGGVIALCEYRQIPLIEQPPQFRVKCVKQADAYLRMKAELFVEHEVDALAHLFAWELANGNS